ncbi:serine/threonine-protein kinase [Spongiactinospora sp. TRM90649]|uniref:WD40 repeat domain-containing serine/threonine protein kinase n=1 Tax=Spongiactinospora sp. TRM90649 TaxID=3031114 RepID=UPI0023F6D279|nr:serine/threonine-protein kinase [Spongiactinospora sp. TRM90649]MDF5754793.1 serine/threonine-protein kinase [Spongiactinospora sp. TRM90649]
MSSADPLRPGDPERLGRYRLLGLLGEGGQGTVFLAEDPEGERVAVKLLHARFAGDASARERFRREVETARRVARFCTVRVLDSDVRNDHPYVVSEYVEGVPLDRMVRENGPRTGDDLMRVAVGTATALAAIHRAGVVHRDFKPSNVLLAADGPRVIDFGIARALDGVTSATTSSALGTPAYMSPEQISGHSATAASDVFAWAITMVFAATGRPAFGSETIPAVLNRILHAHPDLSGLPAGPLRDILFACLAKDPAARPPAAQLLLDLIAADTATPGQAAPSPGGVPAAGRAGQETGPAGRALGATGPSGGWHTPVGGPAQPPPPQGTPVPVGAVSGGQMPAPRGRREPEERRRRGAWVAVGVAAAVAAVTVSAAILAPRFSPTPVPSVTTQAGVTREAGSTPEQAPSETTTPTPTATGASPRLPGGFGKPVGAVFSGHSDEVTGVAFTRLKGRDVAVSSDRNGRILISDLATGKQAAPAYRLGAEVFSDIEVIDLDGRPAGVAGGYDNAVHVWDLESGKRISRFAGHSDDVNSVAVTSLDGRPVVASSGGDGTRLSDPVTGEQIGSAMRGHKFGVLSMVTAELDGKPVVVTVGAQTDNRLIVWDATTRRPIGEPYTTTPCYALAVATVGGRTVLARENRANEIEVVDLATRRPLYEAMAGHREAVVDAAVADAGGRPVLLTASWDKSVRAWDLTTGKPLGGPFKGAKDWLLTVTAAELDGGLVAVAGGQDRRLRSWRLE